MDFDFDFIYGNDTIYVTGSAGYEGTRGDYDTPSDYEAVYNPEDIEITISGEDSSETVHWSRIYRELKDEIVKQIDMWV
jgi:hypothetical protein